MSPPYIGTRVRRVCVKSNARLISSRGPPGMPPAAANGYRRTAAKIAPDRGCEGACVRTSFISNLDHTCCPAWLNSTRRPVFQTVGKSGGAAVAAAAVTITCRRARPAHAAKAAGDRRCRRHLMTSQANPFDRKRKRPCNCSRTCAENACCPKMSLALAEPMTRGASSQPSRVRVRRVAARSPRGCPPTRYRGSRATRARRSSRL